MTNSRATPLPVLEVSGDFPASWKFPGLYLASCKPQLFPRSNYSPLASLPGNKISLASWKGRWGCKFKHRSPTLTSWALNLQLNFCVLWWESVNCRFREWKKIADLFTLKDYLNLFYYYFFLISFIYLFIFMVLRFFFFFPLKLFFFFYFVVNFVIHWSETSLSLHVFPIPIPPPTSLSTRSLQVFPEHEVRALVSCIQHFLILLFYIGVQRINSVLIVSGERRKDSAIHIRESILSQTPLQSRLLHSQPSLWSNSRICTWLLEKPQLWLYRIFSAKECLCFLMHCLDLS